MLQKRAICGRIARCRTGPVDQKLDVIRYFSSRPQAPNRTPHSAGAGLGHGAPPNSWSRSRFICTPAWTSDGRRIQCRSDCRSTSVRNLRISKLNTKIFLNAVALSKALQTTGQRPQNTAQAWVRVLLSVFRTRGPVGVVVPRVCTHSRMGPTVSNLRTNIVKNGAL